MTTTIGPVIVTLNWGSDSSAPPGTFQLGIKAQWNTGGVTKTASIESGLINQQANPELLSAMVSPLASDLLQKIITAVLNA